jgi:hypothetical protein
MVLGQPNPLRSERPLGLSAAAEIWIEAAMEKLVQAVAERQAPELRSWLVVVPPQVRLSFAEQKSR